MRDYSLVTSVVQCSACTLSDDFRGRIKTQMRRYPEIWQGYARNVTTNPQTVTPLYTIATPWVWYQGELNRDVASEYHEIRKRFNVIKNYPPAHRREFRHEAMEFFKAKFGVAHLEDLVGNIAFFEHLASISGKHIKGPNTTFLDSENDLQGHLLSRDITMRNISGSPSDLPKALQESRGKELVVELVGAMRGVTHCRGGTWLSVVTKLVSTMKKLTNTLALEFLDDICNTFPAKGQSLDSFIKERNNNYNVADSIRPLVKQVEDLHDKYYRIKDSSEQLAMEEDIVGKILETFRCGISLEIQHVLVKESWVFLLFIMF
ncbi:hypothetical protein BKA82DRAFT_617352 [Pisolithus tinctorius]|uniref:Uncharacterized protein n=1 Tax=Pisolithus tinctorius Marx 270 TaxID=870435 RepID=A0A0C3MVN5_PISTI|nr:hypothetical protein BKA82DRAFT_617352 [Pisolithus tinctorius]KIN92979.1 hypothetical protein M404DRAFT_617352 [Pisolithus tinctorius Marx 270]